MFSKDIKFTRTRRFLRACNLPHFRAMLALRGFTTEDADHGWVLFQNASGNSLDPTLNMLPVREDKALVDKLDKWENRWFDIAHAVTNFDYPEVHKRLFDKIERFDGDKVITTINVFLNRMEELKNDSDPKVQEALSELKRIGLNEEVINEARVTLETLTSGRLGEQEPKNDKNYDLAEEITLMWEWFKKWAAISRTLDFTKRERIFMGVSLPKRTKATAANTDLESEEDPDLNFPALEA